MLEVVPASAIAGPMFRLPHASTMARTRLVNWLTYAVLSPRSKLVGFLWERLVRGVRPQEKGKKEKNISINRQSTNINWHLAPLPYWHNVAERCQINRERRKIKRRVGERERELEIWEKAWERARVSLWVLLLQLLFGVLSPRQLLELLRVAKLSKMQDINRCWSSTAFDRTATCRFYLLSVAFLTPSGSRRYPYQALLRRGEIRVDDGIGFGWSLTRFFVLCSDQAWKYNPSENANCLKFEASTLHRMIYAKMHIFKLLWRRMCTRRRLNSGVESFCGSIPVIP